MKKLNDLRQLQLIELQILKYIDKFCLENNIKYFIYSGTLLGCIRHKGFIPWDDDIDIALLRDDYEKLMKLLKNNPSGKYLLLTSETEKNYFYPFAKLVDTSTILKEDTLVKIKNYGVYVDIFPFDGISKNNSISSINKNYRIRKKLQKLIFMLCFKQQKSKNWVIDFLKKIYIFFIKIIGIKHILKIYEKFCKKIKPSDSKYVISTWPIYKKENELINSEYYYKVERHVFEDTQVNILSNYDKVLTKQYGNYMKLPPKEKRRTHNPIVYLK